MSEQYFNFEVEQKERLDLVLTRHLEDFSRSRLQNLITQGNVLVNGQIANKKNSLLEIGDLVQVNVPASRELSEVEAQDIPLTILYEDEDLIIVNKPSGLVVHPAPGHPDGTLVNALLAHCQDLRGIGGVERPGIVHRLDRDTTGAMVVAKNDYAHQHLQQQLKEKTARREYWGIVHGSPRITSGIIDQPIGRHRIERKKMAIVAQGGKEAITHWQLKERLGSYSLLNYRLETGRTHQIRVHSTFMGHPIVGDSLYGSGKSPGVRLEGQALHAWRLSLIHPRTAKELTVTAPPPESFNKLLSLLRLRTVS
ncbi:MAG: RluA family pseudouridine synthase [Cyanobacteriota bacterium ELA615]